MAFWWKPAITSMPAMSLSVSARSGFVRIEWGSISFAQDAFTGEPPAKSEISLDWARDSSRSLHIFDGIIYRRNWTDRNVNYDLYEPEYDAMLLDDGIDAQNTLIISSCASSAAGAKTKITTSTDHGFSSGNGVHIQGTISYDGTQNIDSIVSANEFVIDVAFVADETGECSENIVPRPLVIGTVTHMSPQRTGQDIEEKYYLPDFASYSCHDDGVPIDDHWTENGDGTVSRSVTIVGELTMTGTGNMTTLADVFAWAAGRLGLTLNNLHGADVTVNHVAYNNELLVDFLDRLAYYCGYMFWMLEDVLYLAAVDQDNGTQALGRCGFIEIEYTWSMPAKKYSAEWTLRKFDAATVTLIDDEKSVNIYTDNSIGESVSINIFDELIASVRSRITAIAERDTMPIIRMTLPLDQIPNPGQKITFTDRKQNLNITGYMRLNRYSINYESATLDIEGPGEITVS